MADAGVGREFLALQEAVVGRYSLEHELGRGGMGIVFMARDVALDRPVAIKLLPPQLAAQADTRARFLREAQLSARLSHPNIIPIFAVEERGELVWFVMAYVEGETLGHRVRTRGPLTPAAAVKMLQEVAWALAYAHLRGIVHRDVKPDNILLEKTSGRALVSDFGIARAVGTSGGTSVGEILGTAHYMAPEQACGEQVDGRADLYSLGIVAHFALSGRLPFDAPDIPALLAQQITRAPPPLSSVVPGVPGKVAAAVDRCLAKAPDQRWPTGEAFAEALADSQAVARETPVPLRLWLTKGDAARPALYTWTFLTCLVAVAEVVEMVVQGDPFSGEVLRMLAFPWGAFLLYRLYQAQRVIAAGYTLEDVRAAMRRHLEQRHEELAFEYDREPSLGARIVRKLAFAGIGVAAAAAAYVWAVPSPSPLITAWLLGGGAALAVGGGLAGQMFPGKRIKGRDTALALRARILNSKLGAWLFRLAGVGVNRARLPAGAADRPTEVAIGMAVESLFEALPKEARRELKDLPGIIKHLEADAAAQRARVDELNAVLAGLGSGNAAARSSSLRGGDAGAVVAGQQDRLRTEVTTKRDAAQRRLASSVGALENLRLDLLRLKAGVGSLDQLTTHLSDARRLQAEISLAIEARRETDGLLSGEPVTGDR